ncbi:hypothetical protein MKY41_06180 [Sporosarcina sp. FSL W7-1349]|uniref:hypothetical protein n=1 Tax=Sporosarcina sp. FSL W7-1349 TaxID=2921561 RepID=UPI0030F6DA12
MEFEEIPKVRPNCFGFLLFFFGVMLCIFIMALLGCIAIHITYYGNYTTDIFWTLFIFTAPAILTMGLMIFLYTFIFRRIYLPKPLFSTLKEIMGYVSVFSLVIVNAVATFYLPDEKSSNVGITDPFLIAELKRFFVLSIEPINYTYTFPVIFSMATLIFFWFERWDHAVCPVRRKKIIITNRQPVTVTSPPIIRAREIIKEMKWMVQQSKDMLE